MRMATCHPERKHCAKGLCKECYRATYSIAHIERDRTRRHVRYLAHQEERKASTRGYYAAHREERRAYDRGYRLAHRKEINAKQNAHYAAHREEIRAERKGRYATHRGEILAKRKVYYGTHRNDLNAKARAYNALHAKVRNIYKAVHSRTLKLEVLNAYGGPKCSCCGETLLEGLTVDHIRGDGAIHRREIKRMGVTFYRWLKENNYPPGFQVLCFTCNKAKGTGDHCPHKESGIVEPTQTPTGTGAGCHPARPHFAYGLCEECYKAVWYWHRNRDIETRRRILFPVPNTAVGRG